MNNNYLEYLKSVDKKFEELREEVTGWQAVTFPKCDKASWLLKIHEEYNEILECIRKPNHTEEELLEEYVDLVFCCFGLSLVDDNNLFGKFIIRSVLGTFSKDNYEKFFEVFQKKFEKNKAREWEFVITEGTSGVYKHKKKAEE